MSPSQLRMSFLLATVALLAAACGGDNAQVASLEGTDAAPSSSTTSPVTAEEAALQFAQCMRDNGIEDFPDPGLADGGKVDFKVDGDPEAVKEVYAQCEELLAGSSNVADKGDDDLASVDALVELAQCMRAVGYDMPDPNADGSFPETLDKEDPDFDAAFAQCEDAISGK